MIKIVVRKNEPLDKAIRRFETECRKAYIIQTFTDKSYYISPSQKRHALKSRREWIKGMANKKRD
jgi:ribosomal protein S21